MLSKLKKLPWGRIGLAALSIVIILKLVLDPITIPLGTLRWGIVIASTAAGYFVGWFGSPDAEAFRRKLMIWLACAGALAAFLDNGPVGFGAAFALAAIGFWLALGYWLAKLARALAEPPSTFGSSQWAPEDYLRERDLLGHDGLMLGQFGERNERLHYKGDRHLLTFAPTRAGKGTTAIIPNLLTYRGSALVIDPKGENAGITAKARAAMGQTIHLVDPWMIAPGSTSRPSRFNPLDWLVPGDPDMTENAMLLADALVVADGKGEQFWVEEAKALLQGLILYVATDERERGHRHLGRVRDLLLLDGEDMPLLFQRMTDSAHHLVASTGARSLQKEEKLLANVIASAQSQTHFLDSARLRESLSASDFTFEDLKTGSTTVYLILPADRLETFGRWLRLLVQQSITVNARNIEVQPERPILFLLDEMAALGRLSMVKQAYGLMAGFGMQLWGIVQDATQLKILYGEGWETFIGNSGAIQYFGSRDRMTADYFSALCGVTTVWNITTAVSRVVGWTGLQQSSSTTNSETKSVTQRKLAFPDELMRLDASRQLVLMENHYPIMARRERWLDDPYMKARGVDLRARAREMAA